MALAPVALVALALLAQAGAPASAQTGALDGPERQASIRIVDLTTFVPADGILHLILDVEVPRPSNGAGSEVDDTGTIGTGADGGEASTGPVLSVTFYGRLESEAEVEAVPTQPLNRMAPIPLAHAPRTEAGRVHLAIPIRSSGSFDDQDRVYLPQPGVYPVTVELRDPGGALATVSSHVVRQPIETADEGSRVPVEVALVLTVTTAEGLSVADATDLLAAYPTVPLTVVLGQGVINQLRSDPEQARALAEALTGRPVLATPTIDLDPSALAEIGHSDLYLAAARADRRSIIDLGLPAASGIIPLASPLTSEGLEVLGRLGVDAVLAEDRPGTSGVIDDVRPLQVIRPDRDLTEVLGGEGQGRSPEAGPLRANRVLARLTLRHQIDDGPAVIGGSDLGTDPRPALGAFLRSLSQPGAPQPVALSAVAGGPPLRVAERPEQDLAPVAGLVDQIRLALAAYESSHVAGGTEPDEYLQRLAGALTRARNPDDRLRAMTVLAGQLADQLAVIRIHQPQPVTLAARSAPIPLVIDNTGPDPRRVVLRFRGEGVVPTDDALQILVQPGTSSIDVEVVARSLGVSPLEVSAWSGDETVLLAEARFEIRSTAVPGLGLLISLSAIALLGVWWLVDHRKRRRMFQSAGEPRGDETAEPRPTTV